jgi:Flp pilus assembly protein TadB
MPSLVALLPGAALALGIVMIVAGFSGVATADIPGPRTGRLSLSRLRRRLDRAFLIRNGIVVGLGLAALAVTRWPIIAIVVPVLAIVLPRLLSAPVNRDLELLGGLDRWVRLLAATLSTGVSIPDAIRTTRRQVPAGLREDVGVLVARLDDRWTPRQALNAMADHLDSPDADAVIAALVLASERGGTGAVATLTSLADSIQDRLRAGREMEAERAKPRIVVRQVTVVTLVVLGLAFVFGRDFFAPYGTWYGQSILAALIGLYLGSLVWLRRMTIPRRRERILR